MTDANPSHTARDTQREDVGFRILRALDARSGLSQRRLAGEIGISLGATNARLNALIQAGLVEIGKSEAAAAQFRFAYVLTGAGRAEKTRLAGRYLARRRHELAALRREIGALEAEIEAEADRSG